MTEQREPGYAMLAADPEYQHQQHLRRMNRDAAGAVARVRQLHQQYRPAGLDDYDCCGHCNSLNNGYIRWPCPTIRALDGDPVGGSSD